MRINRIKVTLVNAGFVLLISGAWSLGLLSFLWQETLVDYVCLGLIGVLFFAGQIAAYANSRRTLQAIIDILPKAGLVLMELLVIFANSTVDFGSDGGKTWFVHRVIFAIAATFTAILSMVWLEALTFNDQE